MHTLINHTASLDWYTVEHIATLFEFHSVTSKIIATLCLALRINHVPSSSPSRRSLRELNSSNNHIAIMDLFLGPCIVH